MDGKTSWHWCLDLEITVVKVAKHCAMSRHGVKEKKKKPTLNFSWSSEPHHLEKKERSWAKLRSMTICLEQEASLWLET